MRVTTAVVSTMVLSLAMSACGDDDDGDLVEPTPTDSPSVTAYTPTPQQTVSNTLPAPTQTFLPVAELLEQYESNRAKWSAAAIDDYQYQFTLACYCGFQGMPITIMVRDGEVTSMTNVLGETPDNWEYESFMRYAPVEEVFRQADGAIREHHSVIVVYDDQYGFPAYIQSGGPPGVTDSGSVATISDFEALQ
jgi:hypothetical protein